ncbi:hypothetical protein RBH26_21070 [Natronolimnohabitans sp. A-GB9]|uniref:hypothetical protein n=1 Tax=Natronolimnohabitans sp. A-GB9 TaxID=3069757 RepID=UPI0027B878C1|nr:hypothetical protein [Natronolimnohabitans sp. A-GB9]MDQ2052937.1 hypothetical protein [Natronolimnohabitans sp. A-GB9]
MPNRRSVLKTTGTALIGLSAADTVVANDKKDPSEKFTREIIKANRIAKREGLEERQNYLDEKEISHKEENVQLSVPKTDDDEVKTQEAPICVNPLDCDADIDVQFSLTYEPRADPSEFHYSYFIKFRYGFARDEFYPWRTIYAGPEDPVDTLGLSWQKDQVELRDHRRVHKSVITDDYTKFDEGSWTGSGLGILVDGYQASVDSGLTGRDETDWSQLVTAGVFLVEDADFRPETSFKGIYEYAWEGTEPEVSVSYPASISFKSNEYEDSEDFQHTLDGDTFHIKAEEVM